MKEKKSCLHLLPTNINIIKPIRSCVLLFQDAEITRKRKNIPNPIYIKIHTFLINFAFIILRHCINDKLKMIKITIHTFFLITDHILITSHIKRRGRDLQSVTGRGYFYFKIFILHENNT